MSNQQLRLSRKWATSVFQPGLVDTIDLPRGFNLESIGLHFSGVVNVTTAYTGIRSEGLAKLIQRVELVKDGETVCTLPFTFATHAQVFRSNALIKVNPGIAIANYTPRIVGTCDLSHVGGLRSKDSILPTGKLQSLQLRVYYGQLSDMFVGAGACTPAVPALNLDIVVKETRETHNKAPVPAVRRIIKSFEKVYASSGEDRIQLDPNMLYRGVILRTESNGDLSGAVLVSAKLALGSDYPIDLQAQQIVDENTLDNEGIPMPTGYYWIDFSREPGGQNRASDWLDLHNKLDAFLIVNVTGGATNKIGYCFHQFETIKKYPAGNNVYATLM
jgi:hypothetical protein